MGDERADPAAVWAFQLPGISRTIIAHTMNLKLSPRRRWTVIAVLLVAAVAGGAYRRHVKIRAAEQQAMFRQLEAEARRANQAWRQEQAAIRYRQAQAEAWSARQRATRVQQLRRQAIEQRSRYGDARQAGESTAGNWEAATGADLGAMGVR